MTVTRYRIAVDTEFDTWGEPEPDGEWVKYDDIKHLLQHRYDLHTIPSPSAICGLIGCKNQQAHAHDVREPV
mgnify:CR=1 FL=1